jgi:hypothetical protein
LVLEVLHSLELIVDSLFEIDILAGVIDCLCEEGLIFNWAGKAKKKTAPEDEVIDPNNSFHVAYLVGLKWGTTADAAMVRAAVKRFQQDHWRKPTMRRDAWEVVSLMNSTSTE